jgi:hypothetical protein
MQCAGQRPNQIGFWFSLPSKQQKQRDDGQALPNFIPPITTESFGFYNLITMPNNRQAFFFKNQNKNSTNNHNTQPI